MAIVKEIKELADFKKEDTTELHRCTYVVRGQELKLRTYGSKDRKHPRSNSQTLTFTHNSLNDLRKIMDDHDLGR